jgi:hypothetical protein
MLALALPLAFALAAYFVCYACEARKRRNAPSGAVALSGRVTHENGHGVQGALVFARPPGARSFPILSAEEWSRDVTDEQGRFLIYRWPEYPVQLGVQTQFGLCKIFDVGKGDSGESFALVLRDVDIEGCRVSVSLSGMGAAIVDDVDVGMVCVDGVGAFSYPGIKDRITFIWPPKPYGATYWIFVVPKPGRPWAPQVLGPYEAREAYQAHGVKLQEAVRLDLSGSQLDGQQLELQFSSIWTCPADVSRYFFDAFCLPVNSSQSAYMIGLGAWRVCGPGGEVLAQGRLLDGR